MSDFQHTLHEEEPLQIPCHGDLGMTSPGSTNAKRFPGQDVFFPFFLLCVEHPRFLGVLYSPCIQHYLKKTGRLRAGLTQTHPNPCPRFFSILTSRNSAKDPRGAHIVQNTCMLKHPVRRGYQGCVVGMCGSPLVECTTRRRSYERIVLFMDWFTCHCIFPSRTPCMSSVHEKTSKLSLLWNMSSLSSFGRNRRVRGPQTTIFPKEKCSCTMILSDS